MTERPAPASPELVQLVARTGSRWLAELLPRDIDEVTEWGKRFPELAQVVVDVVDQLGGLARPDELALAECLRDELPPCHLARPSQDEPHLMPESRRCDRCGWTMGTHDAPEWLTFDEAEELGYDGTGRS